MISLKKTSPDASVCRVIFFISWTCPLPRILPVGRMPFLRRDRKRGWVNFPANLNGFLSWVSPHEIKITPFNFHDKLRIGGQRPNGRYSWGEKLRQNGFPPLCVRFLFGQIRIFPTGDFFKFRRSRTLQRHLNA